MKIDQILRKGVILPILSAVALAATPCQLFAQDTAAATASGSASSASAAPYGSAVSTIPANPSGNPSMPATQGPVGQVAPQTDFGTTLTSVSPLAEIGTGTIAAKNYALGPGDMINVFVAPQGKYSAGGLVVSQDGFIDYPVLGRITAAGKTAEELSADIAVKLGDYCIDPKVNISVVSVHPEVVYVTGGASSARALDIHAAPTLLKALTLAGGVTDRDSLSHLAIVRGNQILHADIYPLWVNGVDNGQNLDLQPGDTIIVPVNTARVTVVGAVNVPGIQPLDMPSDAAEGPERLDIALNRAGSPKGQHSAKIGQVTIVRHLTPDGKADITQYDYSKFLKTGDVSQDPVLHDNDIVIVPEQGQHVTAGNLLELIPFAYFFRGL